MKPTWKDVSSWSQSTTAEEKKTPITWELHIGTGTHIRLCVSRHIHYRGQWVMRCDGDYHIETSPLSSVDVEDAKSEALGILRSKLSNARRALDGL